MSAIINVINKHFEFQDHRSYPENWNGAGWLPVPEEFEGVILENAPYVKLSIQNDNIVGVSVLEKPEPPPQIPSEIETLQAQLKASDQRADFLEECIVEMAMTLYSDV